MNLQRVALRVASARGREILGRASMRRQKCGIGTLASGIRSGIARGKSRARCTPFVAVVGLVLAPLVGAAGTSQAAEMCPNEAARTGPSAALPDCRAYELVTPVDKSKAVQDMDPFSAFAVPATDGDRIALKTLVAFGPKPMPNG